MVTLHLRLEQFISGFKIFGVAIWAQVTLNVLDALLRLLLQEIIDKIHDMVMDDRRVKVREIASAVGISNERAKEDYLEFWIMLRRYDPPCDWKELLGLVPPARRRTEQMTAMTVVTTIQHLLY
uniref:Uncharacterized protein n=1 Tax=Rhodnius prolixus TaxID=13249 RepID=T1HX56_RHOPR